MIINKESLLGQYPLTPMEREKKRYKGFSYGLTECGYDIRLKQGVWLFLGRRFVRRSSVEWFNVPNHLMGQILNKSSWARLGVDASMTTNAEPGWSGHLTIEIHYARARPLYIPAGVGIAQVIFEEIKHPAQYDGAYQDQPDHPVKTIRW